MIDCNVLSFMFPKHFLFYFVAYIMTLPIVAVPKLFSTKPFSCYPSIINLEGICEVVNVFEWLQ